MPILSKYRPPQKAMQAAVAPPVAPAAPAEGAPASQGFSLPAIDPNDPDAAEKQRIHDAFMALDTHFSQANQGFDYAKHYGEIQAEMAKAPQERHLNPLSKLAIALGTQDPEHPYQPNMGLAIADQTAKEKHGQEMSEFEKTMEIKRSALEGQIKQHMAAGEFRKALKMAETKAMLDVDADRRAHKNKLSEIEATGNEKVRVANINAKASIERADRRIAQAHRHAAEMKLSGPAKAAMGAEIQLAQKNYTMASAVDPMTMQRPDADTILQAEEALRQEIFRIYHKYEDMIPKPTGSTQETVTPSTGNTGKTPHAEDPFFKQQ
jgi:hypothetical protein